MAGLAHAFAGAARQQAEHSFSLLQHDSDAGALCAKELHGQ